MHLKRSSEGKKTANRKQKSESVNIKRRVSRQENGSNEVRRERRRRTTAFNLTDFKKKKE